MYEFFHAVIDLANRVEHVPCWGCGAWLMTPHVPWCGVARGTVNRCLVKRINV